MKNPKNAGRKPFPYPTVRFSVQTKTKTKHALKGWATHYKIGMGQLVDQMLDHCRKDPKFNINKRKQQ